MIKAQAGQARVTPIVGRQVEAAHPAARTRSVTNGTSSPARAKARAAGAADRKVVWAAAAVARVPAAPAPAVGAATPTTCRRGARARADRAAGQAAPARVEEWVAVVARQVAQARAAATPARAA